MFWLAASLILAIAASTAPAPHLLYPPLASLPPVPATKVSSGNTTLREAAAKHGLYMGAARNYFHNLGDAGYKALFDTQYDLNTAENACKWSPTEPAEGQFNYSQCTSVASAAAASGSVFRGHNLCWGNYNPSWLTAPGFNASQLQHFLEDHVRTLIQHYQADKFVAWDVVNEAFSSSPQPGKSPFKPVTPWSNLTNYVEIAFQTARSVTSEPILFYNDYGAEGMNAKSDAIYEWAKGMKAKGLLDGIGLQMHVSTTHAPSTSEVSSNIARLCSAGLKVHITEMDVKCEKGCSDSELQKQALVYAGMLKACLTNSCCKSFETWGATDKYTWLGSDMKPLPFDIDFKPKPAVQAMLAVLA